jgi:uncharacterized protein (DUF1697 family)
MAKYISILRGINVGGARKVPMTDLKVACEKSGFRNVKTYIQSGNVIFDSEETDIRILEVKIQKIITETFGFDVPVIVRTSGEWAESIANNPFWKEKDVDIDRLHLTFLKDLPDPEKLERINTFAFPPDKFQIIGKDVFIFCSAGYSDSKLTNQFFESKLGIRATTRNWKTVLKLHEMVV